jgi:hypothetical protein
VALRTFAICTSKRANQHVAPMHLASSSPWEISEQITRWERAPAPAQVGRRIVEGLFERKLPDARASQVNNVTHWAYGVLAGASYGVLAGSLRKPRAWCGLPFGAAVWLAGYAVLPAVGLYKPIWQYDAVTLAKDLSGNLVYGAGAGLAFAALRRHGGIRGGRP